MAPKHLSVGPFRIGIRYGVKGPGFAKTLTSNGPGAWWRDRWLTLYRSKRRTDGVEIFSGRRTFGMYRYEVAVGIGRTTTGDLAAPAREEGGEPRPSSEGRAR